jgi:hypothetical protein
MEFLYWPREVMDHWDALRSMKGGHWKTAEHDLCQFAAQGNQKLKHKLGWVEVSIE